MRLAVLATSTVLACAAAAFGVMISAAEAHPGALDANGCHHVRRTRQTLCHAGHIRPREHRRFVGFDGVVRHFDH